MGPESVSTLVIWQDAMAIVKEVYKATGSWPKAERYGLIGQVRAAAVSVPANIAEGVGRGTSKEAARFARVALGSLYELDPCCKSPAELAWAPQTTTRYAAASQS